MDKPRLPRNNATSNLYDLFHKKESTMAEKGKKTALYAANLLPVVMSSITYNYATRDDVKESTLQWLLLATIASTVLSKISTVSFTLWKGSSCHMKLYNGSNETSKPTTPNETTDLLEGKAMSFKV